MKDLLLTDLEEELEETVCWLEKEIVSRKEKARINWSNYKEWIKAMTTKDIEHFMRNAKLSRAEKIEISSELARKLMKTENDKRLVRNALDGGNQPKWVQLQ